MVGIGGIGLSSIAQILVAKNIKVSGSDQVSNSITSFLEKIGVLVYLGHKKENVLEDVDLLIVTSAISADNPEVKEAEERGIPVFKRREFLRELTSRFYTIAVAGTHGKTTTTALIALILTEAGFDPTVIIGGVISEFGSNARSGKSTYLVIEADEYDRMFLGLNVQIAIITNVDYDHPDIFENKTDYFNAFVEFVNNVNGNGKVIICGEKNLAKQYPISKNIISYGLSSSNDWYAKNIRINDLGGYDFDIYYGTVFFGSLKLRIPGIHNLKNVLGAVVAADILRIPFTKVRKLLNSFSGVKRRLEVIGIYKGAIIIDSYAHHPTEIQADLSAVSKKYSDREIWAVFQPHTFSRTKRFLDKFARAFNDADHVILTEIFASREENSVGISGTDLLARMTHHDVSFEKSLQNIVDRLSQILTAKDVLITLGAGDVNKIGLKLLGQLDF